MRLIVGLGNPGQEYNATWHNVGWQVLDEILAEHLAGAEFIVHKKSNSLLAKGVFNGHDVIFAKPQTYMNRSGEAVQALLNFYKLTPHHLWVVHDDIDLPIGDIRISHNSSAGGHRGVQNIIDMLGTQEFSRFRIGIKTEKKGKMPTDKFVLQKVDEQSQQELNPAIRNTVAAIQKALYDGIDQAMSEYN